ncbi:hypothetical protein [Streptomyces lydicus]|uniref:hypothetical protein n=1 Tax=Streptomyces lydicus TaxID=47763 RepID=UPI0037AA81C2
MTDPPPRASGVTLLEVRRLRLVEAVAPPVPSEERLALDRAWDEAVQANPSLVTWVRTTYRRYALRRVPGVTSCLPSLFVSVLQPTDDGRVPNGNVGVPVPRSCTTLLSAETGRGNAPELDCLALLRSEADLTALGGAHVDYLEPVMHRYFGPGGQGALPDKSMRTTDDRQS